MAQTLHPIPAARPSRDSGYPTGMGVKCVQRGGTFSAMAARATGRAARLSLPTPSLFGWGRQGKAFMFLLTLAFALLFFHAMTAAAATPAGTAIDNTALVSFQEATVTRAVPSNTVNIVTVSRRTPSTLEMLKAAPPALGGDVLTVPATEYSTGGDEGPFFPVQPPSLPGGGAIDLASVPLLPGTLFHQGESIFLRVTDPDQSLDPTVINTVLVRVTSEDTGDTELVRLYETAPDSGVFLGYLPTTSATGAPFDGILSVTVGGSITARYVDPHDQSDVSVAGGLVDPFGVIFDSRTGLPVNGAVVTLVDAFTGSPAQVFGDDAVSPYPSTITSGASAVDASGTVYDFAPGRYRFPLIAPGTYRLLVQPPAGYVAPSTVSTADLQDLQGAPFAITVGSRGEAFVVNPGPAIRIDIPLDPVGGEGLWVRKVSDRERVFTGDFLQYRVTVEAPSGAVRNVTLNDRLPQGFRYRKGSASLDGSKIPDPAVSPDGRTLTFSLGDIPAGERREIRYVAEVAAGARLGRAVNSAAAVAAGGITSNVAEAAVRVEDAFFRNHAFIAGRVLAGVCDPDQETVGLPGVRIYLEDGSFVVTDEKGMYHFEGVRPGTRVVQLDLHTLPPWYEAVDCETNSRFAGRAYSQFVDVQGGALWQADFHVGLRPKATGEVSIAMNSTLEEETILLRVPVEVAEVPLRNLRLTVLLPAGIDFLAGSGSLDGRPMPDPDRMGNALTFRLGDAPSGSRMELNLRAAIGAADISEGELPVRSILTFDTPSAGNQRTPMLENLLLREAKREIIPQPDLLIRSHFPPLQAELSDRDKAEIAEIAEELRSFSIVCLESRGHTDNLPIAATSRRIFSDNFELSEARARNTANYLGELLEVPPERIEFVGLADTEPLADNGTKEGRALNRRVEVRILCEEVKTSASVHLVKDDSGTKKAPTVGLRPGEEWDEGEKKDRRDGRDMPAFDREWLKTAEPGIGWLWPQPGFSPAIPSLRVAIKHPTGHRVSLLLDGAEVSPLTFEERVEIASAPVAVSKWRGIHLKEGSNRFELIVYNGSGEIVGRLDHTVHYSGPPVRADFSPEHSVLTADGKSPPVIAVRLTDRDGFPAREGVVGEFSVDAPYRPLRKREAVANDLRSPQDRPRYTVGPNGIALIELEPTTRTGEAILRFKLADRDQDVRAWLNPEAREWILVGLAEGTVGYNTITGNMESLPAGVEEHLYEDGRIAFFAKGQVRGEWLVTAAYDSDKPRQRDRSLFQTIDPDTYYTLYGDASQQDYEAPSASKLFLKIERSQFYALWGDYDTGLTVTELSRYSRSLTGFKTELDTGRYVLSAFASETAQAFVRDEIRGDGTSGLYRLSRRDIVLNSEKIVIETRDRLRNEIVLSSVPLVRHLDYNIDYDDGALFFKAPVPSRDENLDPVFIIVDYEAADRGDRKVTWGGRGAVRLLDQQLELGATVVHEGGVGTDGSLYGVDSTWHITDQTRLRAEAAYTERTQADEEDDGVAWLAEVLHRGRDLDGRVYYRETRQGFGLGHQAGSEIGARKYGLDAAWRYTDHLRLEGVAYHQDYLDTGARRDVAEGALRYQAPRHTAHFGLRQVDDRLGDGQVNRSTQALIGGSWQALPRLGLRATHEQSLAGNNESRDFPTRTLLGADYRLTDAVTLFAEQEFSRGAQRDTEGTRAGLKATPWSGGQFHSSLERQSGEDGARMFALYGLKQSWHINRNWSVDGSLDRSQTLRRDPADVPFDLDTPPAVGAENDFTAVSLGATYREEKWSWANRVEFRTSDKEDKWGLFSGWVGEVRQGLGLSARAQFFLTESATTEKTNGELRFGLAYRPFGSRWIILDRLDFLFDREESAFADYNSRRIVNNLNANYRPNYRTQISLQYGAKYVLETIDGDDYSGYTDLIGIEGRYDLTPRWDVGMRGSILHSWNSHTFDYSTGASIGYNVVKNAWISLGYNVLGFQDPDFSRADFTARGPFMKFRIKFDQDSVKEILERL